MEYIWNLMIGVMFIIWILALTILSVEADFITKDMAPTYAQVTRETPEYSTDLTVLTPALAAREVSNPIVQARAASPAPAIETEAEPTAEITTPAPTEKTKASIQKYGKDAEQLLAKLGTVEAGAIYEENILVQTVILNRVDLKTRDFADVNSIWAVICQKNQYVKAAKMIRNGKVVPTEASLKAARKVLQMREDGEIYYFKAPDGKTYSTQGLYWQSQYEPNFPGAEVRFFSGYHFYSGYKADYR